METDLKERLWRSPRKLRLLLSILSVAFGVVYLSIVAMALVLSGRDLLENDKYWTYYAIVVPLLFAIFCLISARISTLTPLLIWSGVILTIFTLPAVFVSFLSAGLLLPVLAIVWVRLAVVEKSLSVNKTA